jgi:hypothetical protein
MNAEVPTVTPTKSSLLECETMKSVDITHIWEDHAASIHPEHKVNIYLRYFASHMGGMALNH